MRVLVIGSSGFVGSRILRSLQSSGIDAIGTSRNSSNNLDCIKFDIRNYETDFRALGITHVVLSASITNYAECETNPESKLINTKLIPELVLKLLNLKISVNYISSNTVFGGNKPWPDEISEVSKELNFQYALQKQSAETYITLRAKSDNCSELLRITRLTKVVNCDVAPFPSWYVSLRNGEKVKPFSDLIFAPITLDYAALNIVEITKSDYYGIFHLSGAQNVNYYDFCLMLARKLRFDSKLISPTNSLAAGVRIPFLPEFSGLSMTRTTKLLGIIPQTIEEVVTYLEEGFNVYN